MKDARYRARSKYNTRSSASSAAPSAWHRDLQTNGTCHETKATSNTTTPRSISTSTKIRDLVVDYHVASLQGQTLGEVVKEAQESLDWPLHVRVLEAQLSVT